MPDQTCSTCRHFHRHGEFNKGECWFNPPVVFASGSAQRPPVDATGPRSGCGQHAAGEAVVMGKVNPDTVGAAAKQAREARKK